jgi:hypothetical protein
MSASKRYIGRFNFFKAYFVQWSKRHEALAALEALAGAPQSSRFQCEQSRPL